jgi:riboflavin kinase/FMN adenylyltransferase
MRRYRSLGDLPLGGRRRVVAIGTFDGIHLGHQAIIRRAIELARERGLPAMALTFEPHPIAVIRPELRTTVLTQPPLKAQIIERLGVDELLVVPFTKAFARIRAERFAEMLVGAPIGAEAVVVGRNFRFGHGGAGTAEMLLQFGRARGLTVEIPEVVTSDDGKPISSTRIRRLVATGHVGEVIPLLGRPHSVDGTVVAGDQRGRTIGLPTANIAPAANAAMPGRGVYAGRAVLAGGRTPAALNIGFAPTFTAGRARPDLRLEAFLIDWEGEELYGQSARIEFLERLRDERRFESAEALMEQVREDIARTRGLASPTSPADAAA